jgi:chaperonin GroES
LNVSTTIKPLEDRILVQPLEAEQTTKSGLVIPDTAKEKPQEGKVLATGPGRIDDNGNRVPLDVSVDDVVIFSKYGGTEVKYDGKDLLLLNARDILAVVTKAGTETPWQRSFSSTRRHAARSSVASTSSPTR